MNSLFTLKNALGSLLFSVVIIFNSSCGSKSFGLQADSLYLYKDNSAIYYDLKNPVEKHFLPYVLAEISGLTTKSPQTVLAVDDETGKIFEYDLSERKIVHSIEFAKSGDYEGVEVVGDDVYVLKSNGDIYRFKYSENKTSVSTRIENDLSRENDTEGLGYDPESNQLLILCKEKGSIKGNEAKGRTVYSFDLETEELSTEPFLSIRSKHLEAFWEGKKSKDYDRERIKFKPSAIAFHPIEKVFYVLASVGKLIVVLNRDGSIRATYPISPRVLSQPEGLCFTDSGDMLISSEGEGDRGYILKFEMKKR